jgi:hypothetical protein
MILSVLHSNLFNSQESFDLLELSIKQNSIKVEPASDLNKWVSVILKTLFLCQFHLLKKIPGMDLEESCPVYEFMSH